MFYHPDALRKLLSNRYHKAGDLERQCKTGFFWAASRGHPRTVQAFLEHGTNPFFLESGQSPLIVASCVGRKSIVEAHEADTPNQSTATCFEI